MFQPSRFLSSCQGGNRNATFFFPCSFFSDVGTSMPGVLSLLSEIVDGLHAGQQNTAASLCLLFCVLVTVITPKQWCAIKVNTYNPIQFNRWMVYFIAPLYCCQAGCLTLLWIVQTSLTRRFLEATACSSMSTVVVVYLCNYLRHRRR